ncbi:hypothetical protein DV453_003360 [Geotrichum candidum]|nr:hypothetical protein DV453_003360 [Geotrichum candidum]
MFKLPATHLGLAARSARYISARSMRPTASRLLTNRFYSTPANNNNNNTSKPEDTKPEEDFVAGVADPGTTRHGYDPLKPRKPLNRIAVGKAFDSNKAEQQATVGFINWKAALFFIATGGGLLYFFKSEKKRLEIEKLEESNRGYGKPLVGGPFNLIDQHGNPFTEKDLLGKFSLIYFGFSMCPDICPDELEKMSEMLNAINKDEKKVIPVFITCDPARDTPEVLKDYLAEFHPDIIGLTGTYDEIKKTCKAYRVYFSTPPDLKPGQDYLVDHSIFFYFMDPEGKYIDVFGRQYDAKTAVEKMKEHMAVWRPSDDRDKTFFETLFGKKR